MNIKAQIEQFNKFRESYNFKQLELTTVDDVVYYKNDIVHDTDGSIVAEHDDFINVGYKLKGPLSKTLSNLFPYTFMFKGKLVKSIESVFQGIKFENVEMQNLVLDYFGLDSNNIKIASNYDWKISGKLFWQGQEMDRFSKEYDDFLTELYVSAIQNPLYKNILKISNKYILHSIGEVDKAKTVFTRYEFEHMLNCLKSFVKV